MRRIITKLVVIMMFLGVVFGIGNAKKVFAAIPKANAATYEINSNVPTTGSDIIDSTLIFTTPTNTYEFWDENNVYNIIYEISNNSTKLAWVKLDSNMKKISEIYIQRYLTKFGNAIYHNGYLYVVYGTDDTTTTNSSASNFASTITIEMVKYNTSGKVVATLPISAKDTSYIDENNTDSSYILYGARDTFDGGNCDLAINKNNIIKCVFAKEMYNGHQMSHAIYVDADTLKYLNRPSTMEYSNKYYFPTKTYWVSHSVDQRVIATEDGQFVTVDRGDAYSRAFVVDKTVEVNNRVQLSSYEMFHFRESSDEAYAYNSTLSCLGNVVEVSDGYILVAGSEKTLSLNYAQSRYMNESQNLFIQKYKKDFYGKTEQTMQMLRTEERKSETSRTDTTNEGSFYLPDEGVTDYGVKWLTNYRNNKTILETRAVAIDNDQVVILWAEKDMVKSNWEGYVYNTTGETRYYYQIIDKNGNVVKGPYEIGNAKLTRIIDYNYKNDCIYWTELSHNSKKIKVNVLDIKLPFADVKKSDWFYHVIKEVYKSKTIIGTSDTKFEPNTNLTRGMLVTILWRMENAPITNNISKKFSDVPSNEWFYHAVNWAASKGIVSGISEKEFKPNDNITREQLAVILRNYSIYKNKHVKSNIGLQNYNDNSKISSWAKTAVQWAVKNKIISGKENGTKIDPQGKATRAEAAAMICNYRQNIK